MAHPLNGSRIGLGLIISAGFGAAAHPSGPPPAADRAVAAPAAPVALAVPAAPGAFDLIGQVGGPVTAVAVDASRAYMGVGARIVVVDLAGWPETPLLGETAPLANRIDDVALTANRLAVAATDFGGLSLVDVRDPTQPHEVGRIDALPAFGDADDRRLAVGDGFAYLVSTTDGLRVFDIRDPSAPREVARASVPGARAIGLRGRHAWIAAGAAGVQVWDVADPAAPREVGTFGPWWAHDLAVQGDHVFVAAWDAGGRVYDAPYPEVRASALVTLDARDGAAPRTVGMAWVPGTALGLAVEPGYGYMLTDGWGGPAVGDALAGVQGIDLADPAAPRIVAGRFMPVGRRIVARDGRVFVAAMAAGLAMLRADRRTEPSVVGRHPAWMDAFDGFADPAPMLRLDGDVTWAAAGGLYGFRFTAGGPREIDGLAPGWHPAGFDLAGDHAVVAVGAGGIRVLAGGEAGPPREVGALWPPWKAEAVRVAGSRAAVAAGHAGLRVLDVGDPAAPRELGAADVGSPALDVVPAGTDRWAVVVEEGLRIVDAHEPAAPRRVGAVDVPGRIALVDGTPSGLVVVAARDGAATAWHVVDARDPASPRVVATRPVTGTLVALDLVDMADGGDTGVGPRLYLAHGAAGHRPARTVTAWDLRDATAPVALGAYSLPDDTEADIVAMAGAGDRIALLNAIGQVWSVDMRAPAAAVAGPPLDRPAPFEAAALASGTVWAAHAGGLAAYDVSVPAQPTLAGRLVFDSGAAAAAAQPATLRAEGDRAYLAQSDTTIGIFARGDRATPRQIGALDVGRTISALDVSDGRAYVGAEVGGLAILDVRDPGAVREIGAYTPSSGTAVTGVAVAGGTAYLAVFDAGLEVVDVRDPGAPVRIGALDLDIDDWNSITVAGATLLVAEPPGPGGRMWAVDVRDPAAPRLIGALPEPAAGAKVWVDPSAPARLYAVDGQRIHILDTNDPLAPRPLAVLPLRGAVDVRAEGGRIHALTSGGDLVVLADVDDPATTPVARVDVSTWVDARALGVGDSLAFVGGNAGARLIDLRDPARPRVTAVYTASRPAAIAVAGEHAFVADSRDHSLDVLDVSDPLAPRRLAGIPLDGQPTDVVASGKHAYVARVSLRTRSLIVVDATDPARPRPLGQAGLPDNTGRVAIAGDRLYALSPTGLLAYDVGDPEAVATRGLWSAPAPADLSALAVDGPVAFVAGRAGLHVIDVGAPDAPRQTTSLNLGGVRTGDLVAVGDLLFVAGAYNASGTVMAVDRRAGTPLAALGDHRAWWSPARVGAVGATIAVVATRDAGVWVLRWRPAVDGGRQLWLPVARRMD